jgi:hypothetical protein
MAVCLLPHGSPRRSFRPLVREPLAGAEWRGRGRRPEDGSAADLSTDDHLVIHASSRALLAPQAGLRCRVSLLLREPPTVQRRYYRILPRVAGWFHRVLTHNPAILAACPNARFTPHGGNWLRRQVDPDTPKTARISIIASTKATSAGHRLRHRIADWSRTAASDLDLLGGGYRRLDDKAAGHLPYAFSVVIENCREEGYFTEKIVDALLCGSVPVYWGAPDIERYFDPRGLVVCRSEDELKEAIRGLSIDDFRARRGYLEANRLRALRYADVAGTIAEVLQTDRDAEPRPEAR